MDYELNIIKQKRGYRWRAFKDGDLFCTGTNYHKSEEDAEVEAIETFCKPWIIQHPTQEEEQ